MHNSKKKDLLDLLSPAYMDKADKALYQQWVASMGGSHALAVKLLISDGVLEPVAEKRLHKLAKHMAEKFHDGAVDALSIHDIVMGNFDRYRAPELADLDFRVRLDAEMYQEMHVREDHKALEARCQIDWDAVNEYRDIDVYSPLKGAYMGKKVAKYQRPTRHQVRNDDGTIGWVTLNHGGGLHERWIPNYTIRVVKDGKVSKERLPLTDFGSWHVLSENRLVKQFSKYWFEEPNRLGVAKIPMSGESYRYGGVMMLPTEWQNTARVQQFMQGKEGQLVLCCPMNKAGHDKFVKSLNRKSWPKTGKLVVGKGHSWITLNKVAEGQLEATLWRTIEQSTGNAVTRMARTTFTLQEWGKKKAELLRDGWTQSRV